MDMSKKIISLAFLAGSLFLIGLTPSAQAFLHPIPCALPAGTSQPSVVCENWRDYLDPRDVCDPKLIICRR